MNIASDIMLETIKKAYPDIDPCMIGDIEMWYYDALKELTKKKDKALRYNEGKPQWSLVHFQSLEPMVRVLEYGTKKYSRNNWKKGLDKTAILESMMRHLTALMDGEDRDPESEELHIGHIMCNGMFWQYFHNQQENKDMIETLRTMR